MSLEIYAHNQWHSFDMKDLSSNEKMVEIHRLGVWVQSLQASGDELEYIRQRFENLPITKGNYCKWRANDAIFILDNLPLIK